MKEKRPHIRWNAYLGEWLCGISSARGRAHGFRGYVGSGSTPLAAYLAWRLH